MNLTRNAVLAAAMAGSMLGGGAIGVAVFGANSGSAQTAGTSTTAPAATNGAPGGTFEPNEDPTDEKGESAQREARSPGERRPDADGLRTPVVRGVGVPGRPPRATMPVIPHRVAVPRAVGAGTLSRTDPEEPT